MKNHTVCGSALVRLGSAIRRSISIKNFLGILAVLLAASVPAFAQFAYVPNAVDRTVSVIDTGTNTVTATIDLPETDEIPFGVAVNPSGTRVYVTNACFELALTTCSIGDPGSVSVINTATNSVIATIPIPYEPTGIAVSPDGTRLYVVNACDQTDCGLETTPLQGYVSVIDVAPGSGTENEVTDTIELPSGDGPSIGVAVSPDGSRLFVTNINESTGSYGSVSVIDTTDDTVLGDIEVGYVATGVVANPASSRLYVATFDGIMVIDTTTNTLIDYQASIFTIGGLGITPDGTRLYAFDFPSSQVAVMDATDDTLPVVATVAPPTDTIYSSFSAQPDGSRVYAVAIDGYVSVISTATNSLIGDPVTVGELPLAFGQFIPQVSIQSLIDLLKSLNLSSDITGSLNAKLQAALAASKAGVRKNIVNQLHAFLNQVDAQEGKALTEAQADQLEAMAKNLISVFSAKITSPPQHPANTNLTSNRVIAGIESLIHVTTNIDRQQGIDTASDPKLVDLQAALSAAQAGDAATATQDLNSFVSDTQSQYGSLLTSVQAKILIRAATRILSML